MKTEKKIITAEEQALLDEQKQIELEEIATSNCLIRVVAGSHAYGTNIPTSDWDERSVFIDDMKRIILPFEKIEQVKYRDDDKVAFEFSKYMSMLLEQNPNVIELLWTDESDILFKSELGQLLIDNRKEFLSARVKDSYVGYAMAQLKRIKGHNKWINNPQPEKEPEKGDFISVIWNQSNNKNYNKEVPTNGYVALDIGNNQYCLWEAKKLGIISNKSWIDQRGNPILLERKQLEKMNVDNLAADVIVKINYESFSAVHTNWKSYWSWKNNRNETRGEMEEKYGYDVKHAMHLIRLLRSGLDILKTGEVPVKRKDAQYLLDIRFGKYTYEEVVKESERLTDELNIISLKSSLPEKPNYELAKELMLHIYNEQWKINNKKINKPNI